MDAEIALDREKYTVEVHKTEEYRAATRSGLAVRKWMEDEKLDSCTVNFLTLDICGLPKMPFPECCKILERGQGYAGEGDVLTAGLVGALMSVYPNSTFTEMFCPGLGAGCTAAESYGREQPETGEMETADHGSAL